MLKFLKLQKGILSDYTDDIAKYAEGAEKTKARACFLSIPKHLAKDYKKFRYSLVEPKATSKSMTSIIQNHGVKHGIKLSAKNVSGNDTVESLPRYMAMFL